MKHLFTVSALILMALFLSFSPPPERTGKKYYGELYRPQFHFTPEKGILGEPTALVFYDGEYHLFYQYRPDTTVVEYVQWGHAVSKDLIRWEHLKGFTIRDENARDDGYCTPGQGCAIVDEKNVTGLQEGSEKTMLIFYTSRECGQRLAYSNDRGRTWKKYDKNPVIPYEKDLASGPYVFYHQPTNKWVMTLYRRPGGEQAKQGISFYSSDDLLHWQFLSHYEGFTSGAELFQLPLDGNESEAKWILSGINDSYIVGRFDGKTFTPETGLKKLDLGKNFHAGRTWTNAPKGKLIQIAWMRGAKYPGMPFDGQMSFPCELTLRKGKSSPVLCRKPIESISTLYVKEYKKKGKNIIPGIKGNPIAGNNGDVLRINALFDLKTSDSFGFIIRNGKKSSGSLLKYDTAKKILDFLARQALVEPVNGKIRLDILLDRPSVEVFANDGEVVISNCFNPLEGEEDLILWTQGGELFIDEIEIDKLGSAWPEKANSD